MDDAGTSTACTPGSWSRCAVIGRGAAGDWRRWLVVVACAARRSTPPLRPTTTRTVSPTGRRRSPAPPPATGGDDAVERDDASVAVVDGAIDAAAPGRDQPADPRCLRRPHRRRAPAGRPDRSTAGAATRRPGTTTRSATPGTTAPTTSSATPTTAISDRRARGVPRCRTPRPASQTRVAVPTLGWVAENDDATTARSRRTAAGAWPPPRSATATTRRWIADPTRRQRREHAGDGRRVGRRADRRRARHPSSSRWTTSPSCGAYTHYDVHPECPTYEEILDKYLAYATAIRAVGDPTPRWWAR